MHFCFIFVSMKIATFLKFFRPKYLIRNRFGFCPVCGHRSLFLLTDTIDKIRNHAICVRCGSVSRHRHVALTILKKFKYKNIRKLSDFGKRIDLAVFNSISFGPIVKAMGRHPHIVCSEYFDSVKSGDFKGGVLCENFEDLSFENETFDLVISEDVFEHLKDYKKGFLEVLRVLKKGGIHVFSIPFYFGKRTKNLFEIKNGIETPLGEIEYHGDPVRGMITTYTHFGEDVKEFLNDIGFDVEVDIANASNQRRFGTYDCFTFVTTKR